MPSNLLLIRRKIKFIKKAEKIIWTNIFYMHALVSLDISPFLPRLLQLFCIISSCIHFFIFLVFFLIFKLLSMSSIKMEEKFIKRKLLKMEKFCEFMIFLFCWSHIIVGIYHHHWNFFHSIWSHFASSLTGIFSR